jgi:hypothetical protein
LASAMVALVCGCNPSVSHRQYRNAGGLPPNQAVTLYVGYPHTESFCAEQPLVGRIVYKVFGSDVTVLLGVNGLPHQRLANLAWRNNDLRGYVLGSFSNDARGRAIQSSLRFFRPGEVRGVGLVLSTGPSDASMVGKLSPC